MTTARTRRRKGRKADYQGATPEQVAKALHNYRPDRPASDPRAGNGNR